MEQNNKNIWIWILVGVIVIVVVVYLALTGGLSGVKTSQEEVKNQQEFASSTGVSEISEQGIVLNTKGEEAKNNVQPGSPEAPQQSNPIADATQVPSSAIKISVSSSGFIPAELTVNSGAPVTLSITATDTNTHVFAFKETALQAVAVGVAPGETRAITFNAPTTKGEYTFFCNVPGHEGRGEVGKMIVN